MNKEQRWTTIKRILAVLMAIFFWMLSIIFSQKGFGISLPTWAWAGWVLALGVTILELILNSGTRMNPTIYIAGIIAYMYGIGTNVYGIVMARTGMDGIMVWDWVLAVIVGLLLEVVPEPVFLYGIGIDVGDLITTLLSGVHGHGHRNGVRTNQPLSVRNEPNPYVNLPSTDIRTERTDSPSVGRTTKIVREYVFRHRKSDGTALSVRDVAAAIGKDKSTVGSIMAEMRRKGEIV